MALTGIGAAAVGLVVGGIPTAAVAASVDPTSFVEAVTVDGVMEHLAELQAIADANGGNRAVGTPGYEASAHYVEQTLREAGYTTSRQPFDAVTQEITEYELAVIGAAAIPVVGIPFEGTTATPDGGIEGVALAPADPLGCSDAAWEGVTPPAELWVAVVSRGECNFSDKTLTAAGLGAAAILVYNNEDGDLNGTIAPQLPEYIPSVGITQAEGEAVLAELDAPVTVALNVQEVTSTVPTFTVLAETPTGRSDNTVMLGAHLDSVPEGPGINDNGSGSAAILEIAQQLAASGELNNQVRFAWWGAEEVGLLGSYHYTDDLAVNDPRELEEIATYLNFDMVASPNYVISVYDADQSSFEAPVEVPDGSIATEAVFTDYFDSIGQPWIDTAFDGRSDYDGFIANGVPASGLFTGADGVKTDAEAALFGGVVGEQHDQNYHTAGDDLANVNQEALGISLGAMAFATAALADDTSAINGVLPPAEPTPDPTTQPTADPAVPVAGPARLPATGAEAPAVGGIAALLAVLGLAAIAIARVRRDHRVTRSDD
ncbi:M20/M25/M40 family metallo-hydrolase [Compostimonas suwonensis]|uniref:M20/M25/M40 family metallo-hydrolase n=1 Tax=Compostimonas suwonensis TaxID=1048394 RepID=UPI001FE7DCD8|nr:M20/M25/M40 family metallo-hydrolase [Compostimonas suwonensis]